MNAAAADNNLRNFLEFIFSIANYKFQIIFFKNIKQFSGVCCNGGKKQYLRLAVIPKQIKSRTCVKSLVFA